MCVNSWVNTSRSQSSVLPMNSDPAGQRGRRTIVLYGSGVAHPLASSL